MKSILEAVALVIVVLLLWLLFDVQGLGKAIHTLREAMVC